MRNASVSIEVSETIYEQVVEPRKKAKTLSKLVATLLQGYISDEYIYSYAEGTIQDMRKAQVDNFDSAIDKVFEHSANIGLFSDELSSLNASAHKKFKDKTNEVSKSVGENIPLNGDWAKPEDLEEVKSDVGELKSSVTRIEEMLMQLMQGGVSVSPSKAEPVTQATRAVEEKQSEKEEVIEDIWKDKNEDVEVSVADEEEDEGGSEVDSSAMDAMASLLQNNEFSF